MLAHQMSQSGFVHWLTNWLHVGRCVNTFDQVSDRVQVSHKSKLFISVQNVISNVLLALFNLLNCAYDSSNHPAFRFAETIPELIPFVEASNFDVASTAKFTLSCLHQQLDCEQLSALKITESEAEFCVTTFAKTIDSPNFKADGFAAHELLQLLTNLTHSYSAVKQFMDTQSAGKRKHNKPGELSYFDQQMLKVAIELEGNSERFVRYGLLNAIERVLRVEQFQEGATKLLCNLLHTETIKSAIESNFPSVIELLQCQCENSLQEDHQLAAYCCLWQIGSMTQG